MNNETLNEVMQVVEKFVPRPKNGKISYCYDKIKIITEKLLSEDKSSLKDNLKPYVNRISFRDADKATSIIVVAISKRRIRTLCTGLKNKESNLDTVEIAKDIEYNEADSTTSSNFPIGDSVVLKIGEYLSGILPYDYRPVEAKTKGRDKGRYTLYFNFSKTFKLVIYARLSKKTKKTVIHLEFRIFKYRSLKTKIGASLTSLRKTNLETKFESLFDKQVEQIKKGINYLTVGKFWLGIHGNVKLKSKENCKSVRELFSGLSEPRIKFIGRNICDYWELDNPHDVFYHFKSVNIKDAEKDDNVVSTTYLENLKNLKNRNHFCN